MKEIRRSKRERARERSELEKITRRQHRKASKNRVLVVRDFDLLLDQLDLNGINHIVETVSGLSETHRNGNSHPDDHGKIIFDPALDDLSTLPAGLLDHKELPLPNELVPGSFAELHDHCQRLIVRSRNPELIAYIAAGLPGAVIDRRSIADGDNNAIAAGVSFVERHARDLWHLSGRSPSLYRAILTGRHGTALRQLRDNGPPSGTGMAQISRLLARHGLIWCCHDIQMTLSRSAIGARNPFGDLISSTKVEMRPEGPINALRQYYGLLRRILDRYQSASGPGPASPRDVLESLSADPSAVILHRRIERWATRRGLDLSTYQPRLDLLVQQIRLLQAEDGQGWWSMLDTPTTTNEMVAHFSGHWFSGLSHVQVAGVAVLRYLQAEASIEQLIGEHIGEPATRRSTREAPAMAPFDTGRLHPGWQMSARHLLALWRREILHDKQALKPGTSLTSLSRNAGTESIKVAQAFLDRCGQRQIGDDHGDVRSIRRTFYLIDIIPEVRLAR